MCGIRAAHVKSLPRGMVKDGCARKSPVPNDPGGRSRGDRRPAGPRLPGAAARLLDGGAAAPRRPERARRLPALRLHARIRGRAGRGHPDHRADDPARGRPARALQPLELDCRSGVPQPRRPARHGAVPPQGRDDGQRLGGAEHLAHHRGAGVCALYDRPAARPAGPGAQRPGAAPRALRARLDAGPARSRSAGRSCRGGLPLARGTRPRRARAVRPHGRPRRAGAVVAARHAARLRAVARRCPALRRPARPPAAPARPAVPALRRGGGRPRPARDRTRGPGAQICPRPAKKL